MLGRAEVRGSQGREPEEGLKPESLGLGRLGRGGASLGGAGGAGQPGGLRW